jgi:feruloyl esterase
MRTAILTLTGFLAFFSSAAEAATCESLRTALSRAHTAIGAAELVPAAAATGVPAHCRIVATLRPVAGSEIGVEILLPAENWNGKFQGVGNGGWAGTISRGAMVEALKDGYATASTDTGHRGGQGAEFALGQPEKVTDFAYRSVHEMTLLAKAAVAAFYDRPARLSYFNGCSTGGRQGMMEAQRFPEDYDGIIVGAPVYNMNRLSASNLARQVQIIRDPAHRLSPEKITLVTDSVLNACDAGDGVRDGIVSNPLACSFDPAVLACSSGDAASCLTAKQIETVKQAYTPVKTKTGEAVYPGSSPGFEFGLRMPDAPLELHFSGFRYIGRQNAGWDPLTFDLEADLALLQKHGGSIEATDPNLAAFKARGGKMLFYHGWADPGPAPANTLAYRAAVEQKLGGSQDDWLRVFLMPGMGHCRGGRGPDQADFVSALDKWRDGGVAPARIDASKTTNGKVEMTRPLCAYPQVARYKGTGSTNDAANFSCQ